MNQTSWLTTPKKVWEHRTLNINSRSPIRAMASLRVSPTRCDFDLRQHQEHSGQKLEYLDPARDNERYIPHVIEPASGFDARCSGADL